MAPQVISLINVHLFIRFSHQSVVSLNQALCWGLQLTLLRELLAAQEDLKMARLRNTMAGCRALV